ncbi:MAG TPA: dihydroorotate dehydrogenase [Candidatus Polarisedimenticolia bacterium]
MVSALAVTLGALRLKNPVLTASGTCGYGLDLLPHFDISLLGGIVCKSLSLAPREGNAPPRLAETPGGMLNSIGLQNIGIDLFLSEKLPLLRRHDTAIVANIFGETVEEFGALARLVDGAEGVAAIEVNISCPNTARGGTEFGVDPDATARVTAAVRGATRLPLIVKLSPNVTDITLIARAAVDAGADILSLVNTFFGMAVDVERRRPILSSGSGGLSGPVIKPMAVHLVSRVARSVNVPLIGIGGIRSGADAMEFILAGASAVEVGTATFTEPAACVRIVREIEEYCARHAIAELRTLIGALNR